MSAYLDIVRDVLANGRVVPIRDGAICIRKQGVSYSVDLQQYFPLEQSKAINIFHIIVETLWYLTGDPSLEMLHRHGLRYWDTWENKDGEAISRYGFWWRHFPYNEMGSRLEHFDQVAHILEEAKRNPRSRRLLVTAWEPKTAAGLSLPPCHVMWHLVLDDENGVGLHLHQRSCDIAVGLPYNTACYALLCHIVARILGRVPRLFTHSIVDAHIYAGTVDGKYDHRKNLEIQLARPEVPTLPQLAIDPEFKTLDDFLYLAGSLVSGDDLRRVFKLTNYNPHGPLKFEVMP